MRINTTSIVLLFGFVITFLIFLGSQAVIYYTMTNMETETENVGMQETYEDDAISLYNNFVTYFRAVFGVLAIGTGGAFVLSLFMAKPEEPRGGDLLGLR